MSLTPSDLKKLTAFYRGEGLVLKNPGVRLLRWFEQRFDIRVVKGGIVMNRQTKQEARTELAFEQGFDVIQNIPDNSDRMTLSVSALNEKLATVKPDEAYVLVSSMQRLAMLNSGEVALPHAASLRVPVADIALKAYQQLVIVENLDVFDALSGYSLPLEGSTLLAYRGHEKSVTLGVKSLIKKAQGKLPVYWFGDLDPEGVKLALSTDGVTGVISAEIASKESQRTANDSSANDPPANDLSANDPFENKQPLSNLSRIELWEKQQEALQWCKKPPQNTHPIVNAVMTQHLAVMQQHLLTHQIALKVYPVNVL